MNSTNLLGELHPLRRCIKISHGYLVFSLVAPAPCRPEESLLQPLFSVPLPQTGVKMLYKFTSSDLENTSIVDCSTGQTVYYVSTPGSCIRARSRSTTSIRSLATYSSSSREKIDVAEPKVTSLLDSDGVPVAEIFWESGVASIIRIGDETLAGTRDLFDASCVRTT